MFTDIMVKTYPNQYLDFLSDRTPWVKGGITLSEEMHQGLIYWEEFLNALWYENLFQRQFNMAWTYIEVFDFKDYYTIFSKIIFWNWWFLEFVVDIDKKDIVSQTQNLASNLINLFKNPNMIDQFWDFEEVNRFHIINAINNLKVMFPEEIMKYQDCFKTVFQKAFSMMLRQSREPETFTMNAWKNWL